VEDPCHAPPLAFPSSSSLSPPPVLAPSRDAAALARFWAWLEEEVEGQGCSVSEMEVIDRLEEFRAGEEGFIETSFDTIAGMVGDTVTVCLCIHSVHTICLFLTVPLYYACCV